MDNPATKSLTPIVAWIPMLGGDDLSAAENAAERFRDLALPQFWDGSKTLGREIGRSVGAPGWTAWDVYLFYPPGAEWTDAGLPPPEAALAQARGVVIGTKGTLPASGDASVLPADMRAHADVVGDEEDLETLLARVAEPFAKRHALAAP